MAAPPRLRNVPPLLAPIDVRVAPLPPKAVDPHYGTAEHVAWRAAVLKRAGYRCQDPACRSPDRGAAGRLFADHVVELKDGGAALDPANGQALCGACHSRKTAVERARRLVRPA